MCTFRTAFIAFLFIQALLSHAQNGSKCCQALFLEEFENSVINEDMFHDMHPNSSICRESAEKYIWFHFLGKDDLFEWELDVLEASAGVEIFFEIFETESLLPCEDLESVECFSWQGLGKINFESFHFLNENYNYAVRMAYRNTQKFRLSYNVKRGVNTDLVDIHTEQDSFFYMAATDFKIRKKGDTLWHENSSVELLDWETAEILVEETNPVRTNYRYFLDIATTDGRRVFLTPNVINEVQKVDPGIVNYFNVFRSYKYPEYRIQLDPGTMDTIFRPFNCELSIPFRRYPYGIYRGFINNEEINPQMICNKAECISDGDVFNIELPEYVEDVYYPDYINCGTTQNPAFVKFTADSSFALLKLRNYANCLDSTIGNQINVLFMLQIDLVETENCLDVISHYCFNLLDEYNYLNGSEILLFLDGLDRGQEYFLVFDGFSGYACNLDIEMEHIQSLDPRPLQPTLNTPDTIYACKGDRLLFEAGNVDPDASVFWTMKDLTGANSLDETAPHTAYLNVEGVGPSRVCFHVQNECAEIKQCTDVLMGNALQQIDLQLTDLELCDTMLDFCSYAFLAESLGLPDSTYQSGNWRIYDEKSAIRSGQAISCRPNFRDFRDSIFYLELIDTAACLSHWDSFFLEIRQPAPKTLQMDEPCGPREINFKDYLSVIDTTGMSFTDLEFFSTEQDARQSRNEILPPLTDRAGRYFVQIKESEACIDVREIVLNFKTDISPDYFDIISSDSSGVSYVEIVVEGGSEPYSIDWEDGVSASFRTGLSDGFHSFTVTDSEACTRVSSVWVQSNSLFRDFGVVTGTSIYPNPIQPGQYLHIRSSETWEEIELTSLTGVPVLTANLRFQILPRVRIPDNLNPGLYFVTLRNSGSQETMRLIVL